MTGRERILAALKREPHDRPTVMLWGLDPVTAGWMADFPSYRPLLDLIEDRVEFKIKWSIDRSTFFSEDVPIQVEVARDGEDRKITTTRITTPRGPISQQVKDVAGTMAGATINYYIENDDDLDRWLSIPYVPFRPPVERFFELDRAAANRGIVTCRFPDPVGMISELFHPEDFLVRAITEPDRMKRLLDRAYLLIDGVVTHILKEGARPVLIFEGPEVATPPMLSPKQFDWMVTPYLQNLIAKAHVSGCLVIVHCHGNLDAVLERFADMGADAIHPVEAPPSGDITPAEFVKRVGQKLSMVGNIQIDALLHGQPEDMAAQVRKLIRDGNSANGLLISTTATPYEIPLSELTLNNYRALIDTVFDHAGSGS
ncbi:uroporphyrinogen decarboxylase family protein [candidate division KSB1 bacterium]